MKRIALFFLLVLFGMPAFAYLYGEHKMIGDISFYRFVHALRLNAGADRFLDLLGLRNDTTGQRYLFTDPGLKAGISYGVLNGVSGDHAAHPFLIDEQLRRSNSVLLRIIALHEAYISKGYPSAPDKELVKTDFNYLVLAAVNISHFYEYNRSFAAQLRKFDPLTISRCQNPSAIEEVMKGLNKTNAINMYVTMHLVAMDLAKQSGQLIAREPEEARKLLWYAMLFNGFADHFLEDAFSAGHLVVNRSILAGITNNKALHDFYSENGATVVNREGQVWKAYGDGNFNNTHHAWEQKHSIAEIDYPIFTGEASRIIDAVQLSLDDIFNAFSNAVNDNPSWQLPAPDTRWVEYLIRNIRSLSLVPIPYKTPLADIMPGPITVTEEMLQASRPLRLRNFIRSRVGNSLVIGIDGQSFSDRYFKGIEFRFNFGSFLKKYNYRNGDKKAGTLDYWNGYTVSFSSGRFGWRPDPHLPDTRVYLAGGGLRSNLDYWITNKRSLSIYSYTEAGIQYIGKTAYFVFTPSLGWQPGALLNFNYYNMPVWLRLPAQFFLPLKTRMGMIISPSGKPVLFSGIDIDYAF